MSGAYLRDRGCGDRGLLRENWLATINGKGDCALKVILVDRGNTRAYTGVKIVSVDLTPWVCGVSGEPRVEPYPWNFVEDGERFTCHRWDNPCGHVEMYHTLLYGDKSVHNKKEEQHG